MQRDNGITLKELKYLQAILSLYYKFKIMYILRLQKMFISVNM